MFTPSDKQFAAAVAAALGESIALVRHRGFHQERLLPDSDPAPAPMAHGPLGLEPDDLVDLADYGVDWDAADDRRIHRRRRMTAPRRKVA
ncbi:MAG: hypothetical protein ACKO3G_06775 [Planctomycetaceae bacterium]